MGIFLYPGVEELDFCGPFEVLKAASYTRSEQGRNPAWQVFTVAEEPGLLKNKRRAAHPAALHVSRPPTHRSLGHSRRAY